MTRRLQRCVTCKPDDDADSKFSLPRGYTRHRDRRCARCRRGDIPSQRLNYKGRAA